MPSEWLYHWFQSYQDRDICIPFIIMHNKIPPPPSPNLKYYHLQYLQADRIAVKLPTGVWIKVLRKRVTVSQTLRILICGLMQQFTYKCVFSTSHADKTWLKLWWIHLKVWDGPGHLTKNTYRKIRYCSKYYDVEMGESTREMRTAYQITVGKTTVKSTTQES